MARFCSLFSSSSGNCTYAGTAGRGILIDAGMSAKQILLSCEKNGIAPDSITAIFITHEHTDHVKGVRVLAEKLKIPVYANAETLTAMDKKGCITAKTKAYIIEDGLETNDMRIFSFETSHDSARSVGYRIELADGRTIAVCTDLGVMTNSVFQCITGCDLVLLESNHDLNMLKNGPYPFALKQRILSDKGHLSNTVCAQTVSRLIQTGTTRFVLGHLSKENNTCELAFNTSVGALNRLGAKPRIDYTLSVATQNNAMILL